MLFNSGGLSSRLVRLIVMPIRTATKRASGGKSANNNTAGRRLGPKKGEGEPVQAGDIIWRQRGTKWFPGENAGIGRDHTIFAREPGYVRYYRDPFHAKRRFIGIALGAGDRLPTPHFDPRRRRFGYTPIDNEEVADFERAYLSRKETQRLARRDEVMAQRNEKRSQRLAQYAEVLSAAGQGKLAADADQLARLDSVYQYLCGGFSLAEARKVVEDHTLEDLELDLRTGRSSASEHSERKAAFLSGAQQVDSVVTFGGPRKLLLPLEKLGEQTRASLLAQIADLAQPHLDSAAGTPSDVRDQILSILSDPVFEASDVMRLKRQYLRRPLPVLLTAENKAELEKKCKKGDGEIRDVWDAAKSGLKRYFVPQNSKLIV